jgi:hypothetical protein
LSLSNTNRSCAGLEVLFLLFLFDAAFFLGWVGMTV